MNKEELIKKLETSLASKTKLGIVYNEAEVRTLFDIAKRERVTLNYISTVNIDHPEKEVVLFTNDYCFGTGVMSDDYVHANMYLPLTVVPRESLPSGKVESFDDFMKIFFEEGKALFSIEEVAEHMIKHSSE